MNSFAEIDAAKQPSNNSSSQTNTSLQSPTQYLYTDHGNAMQFADTFHDNVRYDHKREVWLIWSNHWWQPDDTGEVERMAKRLAHTRYNSTWQIQNEDERKRASKWALESDQAFRIASTIRLARTEHPLADSGENWDCDAWSLGVANGVIDLRSAQLREGKPEDRITKHAPVPFDPNAACPRWEQFLSEVFQGNADLIHYVHKAAGYTLTGSAREHVLFFCHGEGANGKSTFLEIIKKMLGQSYARTLSFQSLAWKKDHGIPTDIADLQGRRFAIAIEVNQKTRFDEQRVKALTGGDTIPARRLYHDGFNFDPRHKTWLAANHKPEVTDRSPAFWQRMKMIPFLATFDRSDLTKCDKDLPQKLEAELPGILAWAVRSCLLWQQEGLGEPPAVVEATAQYRVESDKFEPFFEERCDLSDPAAFTSSAQIKQSYMDWQKVDLEAPDFSEGFWESLSNDRGLIRDTPYIKGKKTRGWQGIRLKEISSQEIATHRGFRLGRQFLPIIELSDEDEIVQRLLRFWYTRYTVVQGFLESPLYRDSIEVLY